MKIEIKSIATGKIEWLEVRDNLGKLKHRVENVPNLLLNGAISSGVMQNPSSGAATYASTLDTYDDIPGSWSQSGNTITRATGAGTFPSSPSHVGNELYWYDASTNTGHRCHVTARASDTSITVSGPAKTITGGKLRRYLCNGNAWFGSAVQSVGSSSSISSVYDRTAGTYVSSRRVTFTSASSGYTLGSIIINGGFGAFARVKLPSTIAIDAEDQITLVYTATETCIGRSQIYELGAESTGIPQKHSMLTVVGNGTNVDVTFSAATHFLAGDKLDMRALTPKKFAISSASSTGTTFTINTTVAHGLTTGDPVIVEGASLAGYNGTFTVATGSGTVLTITDAANPGAMGASGTVRLTIPGTYFDDLGLATIASMVSSSVARITSAITGPAVDPVLVSGDPGVTVKVAARNTYSSWEPYNTLGSYAGCLSVANAKSIFDHTAATTSLSNSGVVRCDSLNPNFQAAGPQNDFVQICRLEWNAGTGKNLTRLKQIQIAEQNSIGCAIQATFNTPFDKLDSQRLRMDVAKQFKRTLDLTGL